MWSVCFCFSNKCLMKNRCMYSSQNTNINCMSNSEFNMQDMRNHIEILVILLNYGFVSFLFNSVSGVRDRLPSLCLRHKAIKAYYYSVILFSSRSMY